jgi:hypothetical protein
MRTWNGTQPGATDMRMRSLLVAALLAAIIVPPAAAQGERPIIDVHIHYSHDAWASLPPPEAIKVLRGAGLKKAFVSSSSDDGTQMLYKEAPDLIVPVLRPYRRRGEIGCATPLSSRTWRRGSRPIPMPASASSTYSAPTPTCR